MKCCRHTNIDAVGTCRACGRGLCPECADAFQPPHCASCGQEALAKHKEEERENLAGARKSMRNAALRAALGIIWNGFFLVMGLLVLANNIHRALPTSTVILNLVACWGISGLPWVITQGLFKSDRRAKLRSDVEYAVNPGGWFVGSMIGLIIKLVFGFVIGAIASPILFLISIYRFKKSLAGMRQAGRRLEEE